jgi:hypothetical protein
VTALGVRNVQHGIMKYVLGPQAESISYVEDACDTSASSQVNRIAPHLSGIAPLFFTFLFITLLNFGHMFLKFEFCDNWIRNFNKLTTFCALYTFLRKRYYSSFISPNLK